jgi:hypothetical protein
MISPTLRSEFASLNTRLPSNGACYRRRIDNSPMTAPLMSNASTAAARTRKERPPVFGSTLSLGIVSRITPYWAWALSTLPLLLAWPLSSSSLCSPLFVCLQNLSLTTLSP